MADEKKPLEEIPETEPPKEEQPSEEEEQQEEDKTEFPKPIDEEPPARFTDKKEENRLGYELRRLQKENKILQEKLVAGDYTPDENEPPLTKREFEERIDMLERKQSSETMLAQFLSEYPDYRPYEAKIRKFMNDSNYQNIPIGFIADGVVGRDLEKIGADKEKKANEEAGKTKTGGSVRKPTGQKKNVWDMSKEEFATLQRETLQKGNQ